MQSLLLTFVAFSLRYAQEAVMIYSVMYAEFGDGILCIVALPLKIIACPCSAQGDIMAPKGKRVRTKKSIEDMAPVTPQTNGMRSPSTMEPDAVDEVPAAQPDPVIKSEPTDSQPTGAAGDDEGDHENSEAVVASDAIAAKKPTLADMALNKKIANFRAKVMAMPPAQRKPNLQLLKESFLPKELSALWMRLSAARGREDISIRKAWDALCAEPSGNAKKREVLFEFLSAPPRQWCTRLLTLSDEISHSRRTDVAAVPRARGELEVQHGMQEAQELIDSGWYQETQERGRTMYVKTTTTFTNSVEKKTTATTARTLDNYCFSLLMRHGFNVSFSLA